MINFTTRKTFLVPSFELDKEEREKLDKFLDILDKSKSNLSKFFKSNDIDNNGRPLFLDKKTRSDRIVFVVARYI